jgi:hypothetical protein
MFSLILGLTAFLLASCGAFFSVQGLATLYSGHFISVCIMAGSLELGKLVAASYLHRYWNRTNFLLKTYLVVSTLILMGITSLGIFGFLTSAYQESYVKVEMIDFKKQTFIDNKMLITEEINSNKKRIDVLNQIRIAQEQRVKEAGNYKLPREQAYQAIEKANLELTEIQEKNKNFLLQISDIEKSILELKSEESKSKDIGTLKFVSDLFNLQVETIIKWFTILIVLVFDPLAISLVLAYNNSIIKKENKYDGYVDNINDLDDSLDTKQPYKIKKKFKPFSVKYQDK